MKNSHVLFTFFMFQGNAQKYHEVVWYVCVVSEQKADDTNTVP